MGEISGARLIARSLKQQGVDYMFGVVGFPVIPIAVAAQLDRLARQLSRSGDGGICVLTHGRPCQVGGPL